MKTPIDPVANYLSNTSFWRKLLDVSLAILILISWGVATGRIPVPSMSAPHTVSASYTVSSRVKAALTNELKDANETFMARLLFHNGQSSLNRQFNFIRYSMVEYVSQPYLNFNPVAWSNISLTSDIHMIAAFLENKCYSKRVQITDPMYNLYASANTRSVTACPIFDQHNALYGFILLGRSDEFKADEDKVRRLVDTVGRL